MANKVDCAASHDTQKGRFSSAAFKPKESRDSAHQAVLVLAAQLAQHHDELDGADVLVAQAVVRQRGTREHVAADRDA